MRLIQLLSLDCLTLHCGKPRGPSLYCGESGSQPLRNILLQGVSKKEGIRKLGSKSKRFVRKKFLE